MTDAPETARRMLDEKQVLNIIPVGHTTLWRMEKKGGFPKSTYISPNRRIWFEDEIVAWQKQIEGQNRGAARRKR
jgi:prophage regulatory protein